MFYRDEVGDHTFAERAKFWGSQWGIDVGMIFLEFGERLPGRDFERSGMKFDLMFHPDEVCHGLSREFDVGHCLLAKLIRRDSCDAVWNQLAHFQHRLVLEMWIVLDLI